MEIIAVEARTAHLSVYRAQGKLVLRETLDLPAGAFAREVDLSGWPAGIYWVHIDAGGTEQRTVKLLVR